MLHGCQMCVHTAAFGYSIKIFHNLSKDPWTDCGKLLEVGKPSLWVWKGVGGR